MFGKAERGCTYSAGKTTNHTSEEFTRKVYTAPTRSVDDAIAEDLMPRPTVVGLWVGRKRGVACWGWWWERVGVGQKGRDLTELVGQQLFSLHVCACVRARGVSHSCARTHAHTHTHTHTHTHAHRRFG